MKPQRFPIGRILHFGVFFIALTSFVAWTATAVSFHLTGPFLIATWSSLGVVAIAACFSVLNSRRIGWLTLLLAVGVTVGWYQSIRPADNKQWAFDVAHGVHARIDGSTVHLGNVRNFDWQSIGSASVSWEDRTYDLDKLASVDMLTSVWDNPDIAHLIVSFGFSDGQRVAFSVETRRESHEEFSSIGGFFRKFELVLIAATEEDIVKLRTNHRQEDVRLYPITLSVEQRRKLFLSYAEMAMELEEKPAFYNTLTRNCTTAIYPLANGIKSEMGLDWRVLLSGHLPSYIDRLGGFADDVPIEVREERAAITELALSSVNEKYSDAIRAAYQVK